MVKPYFTRKNLIIIALAFFYSLIIMFTCLCVDGAHKVLSAKNIINLIYTGSFSFKEITGGVAGFITMLLIAIYILLFVVLFLYERRYAAVNNIKKYSPKMIGIYAATFALCFLLSVGVGLIIQATDNGSKRLLLQYVGQIMVMGTVIYVVLFGLLAFGAMLIINFLFVDKPFKFWDKKETVTIEEETIVEKDVTSSFNATSEVLEAAGLATTSVLGATQSSAPGELTSVKKVEELDDREKVFPALSAMDIEYEGYAVERMDTDDLSLADICTRFRNYLAKEEGLYFDEDTIRFFVSGLGTSHFMILEGLSGTGKSSLPRYFSKFCNANLLFVPVQTTWRDKTSILGYFNDFTKTYSETDFLLNLYHANYNPDQIHIFVLDEMNISRVEYYFADLLSVLEYPVEDWRIRLMQMPYNFLPPAKLEDGFIQIPANSYFIGTANKDDSTYSITDKVYDRAITIDFTYRNEPFTAVGESSPINLSFSKLQFLFDSALMDEDNFVTNNDYEKLNTITSFIYEQFDLTFGNRILNQIETLVPIFVACGGSKEDALDFLLTRKLISKLEGRFEEYVKPSLKQLLSILSKTYGAKTFKRSEKAINTLIRRL